MRCLVVYFSLTGNTRKVAEQAARELHADLAEVRAAAGRYRRSGLGFWRAVLDSLLGRLSAVETDGEHPDAYDLVVLLAPIWAGHVAPPMRAYLAQESGKLKRAAFVITSGGPCPVGAFAEMARLAGVAPEATFALRESEIKAAAGLPPALSAWLQPLKLRSAA